jgi:hypothetical protein
MHKNRIIKAVKIIEKGKDKKEQKYVHSNVL